MDEIRNVPFSVTRAEDDGDGLTLEGYAAVFDSPTEINGREGHFIERIKPGAFKRTLSHKMPVLMFNHGQHPLIGDMPLGKITNAREDDRGLFISARLADNWLIQPVRDAISSGAVEGMSFRFSVPKGGDSWRSAERGGLRERDLLQVSCSELGPVVFPAYDDTSVGVRSQLREVLDDPESRSELARALFAFTEDRDTMTVTEAFADPGFLGEPAIPINTPTHALTAWGYMSTAEAKAPYTAEQVAEIQSNILSAAEALGFPIEQQGDADEASPATETEPADGTSDSPGMNSADPLDNEHSTYVPGSKELRRQGQLLLAQHEGVIPNG